MKWKYHYRFVDSGGDVSDTRDMHFITLLYATARPDIRRRASTAAESPSRTLVIAFDEATAVNYEQTLDVVGLVLLV